MKIIKLVLYNNRVITEFLDMTVIKNNPMISICATCSNKEKCTIPNSNNNYIGTYNHMIVEGEQAITTSSNIGENVKVLYNQEIEKFQLSSTDEFGKRNRHNIETMGTISVQKCLRYKKG